MCGELVTFTCTVPAASHTWVVPPPLDVTGGVTRFVPTFTMSGVTIVTTAVEGSGSSTVITSALSVTSFRGFSGTTITCIDSNLFTNEIQDTITMVFGESNNAQLR